MYLVNSVRILPMFILVIISYILLHKMSKKTDRTSLRFRTSFTFKEKTLRRGVKLLKHYTCPESILSKNDVRSSLLSR